MAAEWNDGAGARKTIRMDRKEKRVKVKGGAVRTEESVGGKRLIGRRNIENAEDERGEKREMKT